jgi:hypothetical protein
MLARGADPAASADLALRARQLTRRRTRRSLAAATESLLRESQSPPRPRCYLPERLNRAAVREASADLTALTERLRSESSSVRAAATISWLLTDAEGRLYVETSAAELGEVVRAASAITDTRIGGRDG